MRLGKHVRKFHWVQLASFQMVAMAVLSDVWFAGDAIAVIAGGSPLDTLWPGYRCAYFNIIKSDSCDGDSKVNC